MAPVRLPSHITALPNYPAPFSFSECVSVFSVCCVDCGVVISFCHDVRGRSDCAPAFPAKERLEEYAGTTR